MQRIEAVLAIMAEKQMESLFITREANIRYLSGFTGGDSFLLLAPQAKLLITDSRYIEQAARECPGFEVVRYRSPMPNLEETLQSRMRQLGITRLGFEADSLTYDVYARIATALAGIEFIPTDGIVAAVRLCKDQKEIDCIRQAAWIADQAFARIIGIIQPGVTEMEIARELDYLMKKGGASDTSFQTIIASGANSSLPHAIPSLRQIQRGDLITMDFGAVFQGYCSDITRTVVVGEASPRQREIYDLVLRAQAAGLAAVKAGIRARDVDQAARQVIEAAGFGDYFGHSLGHGVGLEIHELPTLSGKCDQVLAAGMVATVEPGIYLPEWGGVRIEDTVAVTADGCEILTKTPKDLLIV